MTKGSELEKAINKTNLMYRKDKTALILKVPVPIIYTATGMKAQTSTVDYTGLINSGIHVAFDAKECENKTSFPLKNIHDHQLLYLQLVKDLHGLAFFAMWFKKLQDQIYIVPISLVQKYWSGTQRKSIPITDFQKHWLTPVNNYIQKVIELTDELY